MLVQQINPSSSMAVTFTTLNSSWSLTCTGIALAATNGKATVNFLHARFA